MTWKRTSMSTWKEVCKQKKKGTKDLYVGGQKTWRWQTVQPYPRVVLALSDVVWVRSVNLRLLKLLSVSSKHFLHKHFSFALVSHCWILPSCYQLHQLSNFPEIPCAHARFSFPRLTDLSYSRQLLSVVLFLPVLISTSCIRCAFLRKEPRRFRVWSESVVERCLKRQHLLLQPIRPLTLTNALYKSCQNSVIDFDR